MQRFFLCCAFLLISGALAAQKTICVTGTVIDAATDEPLAGVSVLIPGAPNSTVTDVNGRFTLLKVKAKKQYGLKFQYIGYTIVRETFSKQDTVLKVSLEARAHYLQEVVVKGYPIICVLRRTKTTYSVLPAPKGNSGRQIIDSLCPESCRLTGALPFIRLRSARGRAGTKR